MQVSPRIVLPPVILVAVSLLLLWLYAAQLDDEHEALVADQIEVVMAARNIQIGDALSKSKITTQKVPRKFLPPNPLMESELNIYLGTPVAKPVEEGQMILTSDFTHALPPVPGPAPAAEQPGSAPGNVGRLLIKTARIHLQSDNPLALAGELASLADQSGGYVVSSNSTGLEGIAHIEMTVRIPAPAYDKVLQGFRAGGMLVAEALEGTDVTDKFVDLDAQARNHRALEARLLTFLEKANTVDEAIALEEKIAKVRTESDQLEGRANTLRKQDALSTIIVAIDPPPPVAEVVEEAPAPTFAERLASRLERSTMNVIDGLAGLLELVVAAVPYLFALAPFAFGALAIARRRRQ